MLLNTHHPSADAEENKIPALIDGAPLVHQQQHPPNSLPNIKDCVSPLATTSNTWKQNNQNSAQKRKEAHKNDQPFLQANQAVQPMATQALPQQHIYPKNQYLQPHLQLTKVPPFNTIHPNDSAKSLVSVAQPTDFASIAIQMHVSSLANAKFSALAAQKEKKASASRAKPRPKATKDNQTNAPSSALTSKKRAAAGGNLGRPPKNPKRPRGRPSSASKQQTPQPGQLASLLPSSTAAKSKGRSSASRAGSADAQGSRPKSSSSAKRAKHEQRPATPNPLKKNPSSRSLNMATADHNKRYGHDADALSNASDSPRSSTPPPVYSKQDLPTFSDDPMFAVVEYLRYLARNVGNLPKFPPYAQQSFNLQQRTYRDQLTRILLARDGRSLEKPRQEGTRRSARARSAPDLFHPVAKSRGESPKMMMAKPDRKDILNDFVGDPLPEGSNSDVRQGPGYQSAVPLQMERPSVPTEKERKYCGAQVRAAGSLPDGAGNSRGKVFANGAAAVSWEGCRPSTGALRDMNKKERFAALKAESSRLMGMLGQETASAFGIGSMGLVMADSLTTEQQWGIYTAMKEHGRNFYKVSKHIAAGSASVLAPSAGDANGADANDGGDSGGNSDGMREDTSNGNTHDTTTQQQQPVSPPLPPPRPRILSAFYYDVWKMQGCPAASRWYADKAAEAAALEEEERELEKQRELEAARRAERQEASWRRRQVKESLLYVRAAAKIPGSINFNKPIVRERVIRIRRVVCKEFFGSGGKVEDTSVQVVEKKPEVVT